MNTISLKQAKRLAAVAEEKGFELLESNNTWERLSGILHDGVETSKWLFSRINRGNEYPNESIPAFTADELLETLPSRINRKSDNLEMGLRMSKASELFYFDYIDIESDSVELARLNGRTNPAEALCELYIYLISNDLVK